VLQHQKPDDYVLATNTGYTVRQLAPFAFETVGLDYEEYVRKDERYFRPTEVDALIGDSSKAKNTLGWIPRTLTPELAKRMVE
jgi:GDPmannose 4,6-dehydratase